MTPPNSAPDLSDVSVVVLSHNRKDVMERNLISLLAMVDETSCQLIVVDNASTDGSAELIRDIIGKRPDVHFIASNSNLGVAGGRNAGWRNATRDTILNIDDDTLVSAEAVSTMLSTLLHNPRVGIVSPRILHAATGAAQFSFNDPAYRPSNFHGACHLVRRTVVDVAGFNDESCTFGGEELDMSIRARAAGFDVAYDGGANVLHDNMAHRGEIGQSRRQHWIYNFTRIFFKHFPLSVAIPFALRYCLSHLVSGVRIFGPACALVLVNAAMRGFRDGRHQHDPVPAHVVRFYRNSDLLPDFGNRPLWRKLAQRSKHR
jgi:GT2 family glycosyltransferase